MVQYTIYTPVFFSTHQSNSPETIELVIVSVKINDGLVMAADSASLFANWGREPAPLI
jgi:hypothetical protein